MTSVIETFKSFKKPTLSTQVLIGMLLGITVGVVLPEFGVSIQPLATLFLRMIKMLIAPLIFATLVIGIAGTGDHKNFGRLGLKTILYFELATIPALIIGMAVANYFKPGAGMGDLLNTADTAELTAITGNVDMVKNHTFWDTLVHMVPESIIEAMATGEILQIVVFSVFFALALMSAGEKGRPIINVLESLADVMFEFVGKVMAFAPMGVMAAIAATVGQNGLEVLWVYAKLVGSLYFALIFFVFTILFGACTIARVPFFKLLRGIKDAYLLAFSTASSESALPKAMETMERFGVPKNVVSFVIPTGYSFNLDGSTLYLGLASLFVAQLAGIELSLGTQVTMILVLMLTTKGVAAVPRASLVVLAATLTAFGLPLAGVAVILGIDHFLDMGRTSINLLGNCVAAAVVARWEGVLDDEKMAKFGTPEEEESLDFEPVPA